MKRLKFHGSLAMFLCGVICGALLSGFRLTGWQSRAVADAQETKEKPAVDLAALQQDVEVLKAKAADQAHAMSDVDYHFANLWFAAKAENWLLADFSGKKACPT